MASKIEDDYWNATSGSSFIFDDESELGKDVFIDPNHEETDEVFNSTLEVSNTLPIRSILSKRSLDDVLDDIKLPKNNPVPPPEDTIKAMYHDEFYTLHFYRTLDDKIALLDKAIDINDGNIILKIVLYLSKTLKATILYRQLKKRPIALQHFASYLIGINNMHDLELLHISTGNKNDMSQIFYASVKNTSINNIQKKLLQFPFDTLDDFERSILNDYKRFVQYKIDHNLTADTPIMGLAELYNIKIVKKESFTDANILDYIKMMRITDFQSDWILMNVIAANQAWNKINDAFLKSNWFTKKTAIKSNVNLELMISGLHKHDAPRNILSDFLSSMDDTERSLYLGKKLKCHKYVIDTLYSKRDRQGLIDYKSCVPAQSDYLVTIDNLLISQEKKWAN